MSLNLNDANNADTPIPGGTVVVTVLELVPGFGTPVADGTMSRSSDAVYAVFKQKVVWPENYAGSMLWDRPGLIGKGGDTDSYYARNGKYRLRRMVESARGVEHDDMSPEAMAKRDIPGLNALHGAKIVLRVEHELDGNGAKRMVVGEVLTPSDYPEYADAIRDSGGERPSPLGDDGVN